jgi:hypothetical protein
MNNQPLSMQGEPSENVNALLERIQSTDPNFVDEDNAGAQWGHYQFTGGGLTLSSSLTSWQDIGNVSTAFKLVAGALKTCQEARQMCEAGTTNFISDVYLEKTLEHLEHCWVGAGGVCAPHFLQCSHIFTFLDDCCFSPRPTYSYHDYLL